ncbi:unnamed protein product [Schistosoma rodhaini]|nr:unnamed protein product [Schistosoma rodhaini]
MNGSKPHISITFRKSKRPKLNDSVRIMRNRGLLNTSRRLLQKSVNQSFTSATSLRANNASLAKKLAELQVELNNQKLATQQANIELLNCRMEVARLQAYKETKERIKACILNVHELLCSQIEMGMSMMTYVKDSISVLDKNDSLDLLSNPISSLLGETAVDPNALDSVCRKEFTKSAQQITEENVCQLSIVCPEIQSPSSSISLVTGPVKMAFVPKDHSNANHIYNNRLDVQPIPLIETLNTDLKSSQSIREEPLVVVSSCEEVLPEILTSPITCISENNITSKQCLPTVVTYVNNVDLDNDDDDKDNTHKNISPIHFSVPSLQQSCISVNKSSVVDPKNIDQLVVSNLVNSSSSKNKEYVVNTIDHHDHEIQSARPHLVRQARLNSKPIIDTSSFMESFVVKTTTTKEKKKKTGKHRLIRVRDSDDESEDDDVNNKGDKLKNNIGVVGGDGDGGGRVIETCFRRPGEFVFRVDSKNVNPSSTNGVSDHNIDRQATRSKSKPSTTTINQQSRSKSKPHTTTSNINSNNNDKTDKELNINGFKKLSKVVGAEVKTVNIFDLSMNRTADLSVLPPTLNDLRIKHKEQRQQVHSNAETQKDTTAKMTMTKRKRSVLGELVQQENEKLSSVIKNIDIVDEHRRLSVVLTPICNENQPPFDAQISNSKNNKRQFRRLYLFDQENEDNNDNVNNVDNEYRLKNTKTDVGNTASKQLKYNNLTSSIGKLDNNQPVTTNPKVTTSRSRKKN